MAGETLRVTGYRELLLASKRAEKASQREVRDALRNVAQPVRAEAVQRFAVIDTHTATNYRIVVRQRGVAVEQRLGKVTGKRPDYGALQMTRALIPALRVNQNVIDLQMQEAMARIARHFEAKP